MNLSANSNLSIGTFTLYHSFNLGCHFDEDENFKERDCHCGNWVSRKSILKEIFWNSGLSMIFLQNVSHNIVKEWRKELPRKYKIISYEGYENPDFYCSGYHVIYDQKKLEYIEDNDCKVGVDGINLEVSFIWITDFMHRQTKKTIRVANCCLPEQTQIIKNWFFDDFDNREFFEEDIQCSNSPLMENESKVESVEQMPKKPPIVDFKIVLGNFGEDATENNLKVKHPVFSPLKKRGYQFDGDLSPTGVSGNHRAWIWVKSSLPKIKLTPIHLDKWGKHNWKEINLEFLKATDIEFPLALRVKEQRLVRQHSVEQQSNQTPANSMSTVLALPLSLFSSLASTLFAYFMNQPED